MAYDYFKVIIPQATENQYLSDGPYRISGLYNYLGQAGETILKNSVTKAELLAGVPVSASNSTYHITTIKVTSLDASCPASYGTSSINTLPGVTPNTIYVRIRNTSLQQPYGVITNVYLRTTGSATNYPLALYKNNVATSYPIYSTSGNDGLYTSGQTEYTDFTVNAATGSIDVAGDYEVYVRVRNQPSNTGKFSVNTPKLWIYSMVGAGTITKSQVGMYSGSTGTYGCTGISGQACLTNERIYKFRTGYINGNSYIYINYAAESSTTTTGTGTGTTTYCVDPATSILLSENGNTILAGDLKVGDIIYTYNYKDNVKSYGYYEVSHHHIMYQENKYLITFTDGSTITISDTHKFMLADGTWLQVYQFTGNEIIKGIYGNKQISNMVGVGGGDVVWITVPEAGTYISNGLISHNLPVDGGIVQPK